MADAVFLEPLPPDAQFRFVGNAADDQKRVLLQPEKVAADRLLQGGMNGLDALLGERQIGPDDDVHVTGGCFGFNLQHGARLLKVRGAATTYSEALSARLRHLSSVFARLSAKERR